MLQINCVFIILIKLLNGDICAMAMLVDEIRVNGKLQTDISEQEKMQKNVLLGGRVLSLIKPLAESNILTNLINNTEVEEDDNTKQIVVAPSTKGMFKLEGVQVELSELYSPKEVIFPSEGGDSGDIGIYLVLRSYGKK